MAIPLLASIVTSLVANNLPKLAQAVVDKGVEYVEEKTGIKLETNAEGQIPPDKIAELKIAAMEHEEFKIEAEQKKVDAEHKNTADARDMQKEALKQDDLFSKRFVMYFAIGWSLFAMVYLGGVTFLDVPESSIRIVDTIIGFLLGTLISTIMNFFFGSSRGSQMKDEVVKLLTKKDQNEPK
jgi:hypothetical protein